MSASRRPNAGFTLIEVLAALAIAATGLLAVSKTISSSVDVANATATRTVAYWVAANHMAELRLSDTWPSAGGSDREVDMGARQWRLERSIEATRDDDVLKVQVRVYEASRNRPAVATLNGYIARLAPARPRAVQPPGGNNTGGDNEGEGNDNDRT